MLDFLINAIRYSGLTAIGTSFLFSIIYFVIRNKNTPKIQKARTVMRYILYFIWGLAALSVFVFILFIVIVMFLINKATGG